MITHDSKLLHEHEHEEIIKTEEKIVIQNDSSEELHENMSQQKQENVLKVSSAADDMSSMAVGQIMEFRQNNSVSEKLTDINMPVIREKTDTEVIKKMSLNTKCGIIRQVRNCPELKDYEDIKGLLDRYLFILSKSADSNPDDEDRSELDLGMSRSLLKSKISESLAIIPMEYKTEQEKNIFENLKNMVDSCYKDDLKWKDHDELVNTEADTKWDEFREEFKSFSNHIDQNPIYDKEDKLVRKIELYRTYEDRINSLADNFDEGTAQIKRIDFAYEMKKMEDELQEFTTKRNLVRKRVDFLNARLLLINKDAAEYAELSKELESLKKTYRSEYASSFKQDLFDIDQLEIKEKNRKADETLNTVQIQTVRQLDMWMLDHAEDDYKDKGFMAQVLGCTVRERLAMYMCIEMDNFKPDYAELVFSQSNYLPNEETIKKKMFGHSLLRKLGVQRIHWSKMRKAYEYVTGKSGELGNLADMAVRQQELHDTSQSDFVLLDQEITEDAFKNKAQDQNSIDAVANLTGEELHIKVLESGAAVVKILQDIRNSEVNDNTYDERLKNEIQMLRALVDKEEKDAEDKGFKKHWSRYKSAVNAFEKINKAYGLSNKALNTLRNKKVFSQDSTFGKAVDGTGYAMLFGDSAVKLMSLINSTGNMMADWQSSSRSANFKAVIGTAQSINALGTSVENAAFVIKNYGTWAEGFKNSRNATVNKIRSRVDEGLSANKIDFSRGATYFQLVGSGLTVGSSVLDYYNIDRSRRAAKTIREQVRNRQKNGQVDSKYREDTYKKSVANLTDRLNVRKGITATTNILSNGTGYLKYVLSTNLIGAVTGTIDAGIKFFAKGLDKYLKSRSDSKTVDDFLDLDQMLREYKEKNADVDIENSKVRKQFRKYAMMQLGFANTKTFFAHVASRLGCMIHDALDKALQGDDQERENVKPLATIVKAMGLGVNFVKRKIPSAKMITSKLSS